MVGWGEGGEGREDNYIFIYIIYTLILILFFLLFIFIKVFFNDGHGGGGHGGGSGGGGCGSGGGGGGYRPTFARRSPPLQWLPLLTKCSFVLFVILLFSNTLYHISYPNNF